MYLIHTLPRKNNIEKRNKNKRKNWTNEVGKKCTPKQEKIWYCIISFPVKLPMCSTLRTRVKGMVDGREKAHKIIYKTLCTEIYYTFEDVRYLYAKWNIENYPSM